MIQELKYFKLPPNFRGKNLLYVQLWNLIYSIFFKFSPQIFYGWRALLLKLFGAHIGKGVRIRPSVGITYPWKISIGDYSWIGDNVTLYSLGDIIIGSNVVISQYSYICTGSHVYNTESFHITAKQIIIKNKTWIATDVFVAPGVTIGEESVIGARSSVFNDVPPNSVCIGNPAVKIKDRQ